MWSSGTAVLNADEITVGARRRELAKQLRKVAETFAEVPDGRDTAHTLGLLAHMLDAD